MKSRLYFGASAIALTVAAAATGVNAADLSPKAMQAPAPAPAAFSWTGFYVGVNAGAGASRSASNPLASGDCDHNVCVGSNNTPATPDDGRFTYNGGNALPFGSLKGMDVMGAVGGAIGFNYQFSNNLVVGLEADYAKAAGGSQRTRGASNSFAWNDNGYCQIGSCNYTGQSANSFTSQVNAKSIGTARARVGFAVDRTLLFATGGLAFGNVSARNSATYNASTNYSDQGYSSNNYTTNTNASWAGRQSKMMFGWAAGAGVEHAISDHLTLKLDALYYNLGSIKTTSHGVGSYSDTGYGGGSGSSSVQPYTVKNKVDGVIARVGLNYKF